MAADQTATPAKRPVNGPEHLRCNTCLACEHCMKSMHFGSVRSETKANRQDQVYNAFAMTLWFSFGFNSLLSLIYALLTSGKTYALLATPAFTQPTACR